MRLSKRPPQTQRLPKQTPHISSHPASPLEAPISLNGNLILPVAQAKSPGIILDSARALARTLFLSLSLSLCYQPACKSCRQLHLQFLPRANISHHLSTGYLQGPSPCPWIIPTAPQLAPAAALSSLQPKGQGDSLHLSSKRLDGSCPSLKPRTSHWPARLHSPLIASQYSPPPSPSLVTVTWTAWLLCQGGTKSFVPVDASAKNALLQTSTRLPPSPCSQRSLPQ